MNEITAIQPAPPTAIQLAGQVANHHASSNVFADYGQRKAGNSLRARLADLQTWAAYLAAANAHDHTAERFQTDPHTWAGVTWGLVAGFVQWMLGQGLALSSINRKLSTVKVYASLAAQAGVITGNDLALIKTVKGYAAKEFKRVDDKREQAGRATRKGNKKGQSTKLTPAQAKQLKSQPDTPQGRRDAVIMALLIDHGLRVGELVELQTTAVDLQAGELRFYRPKVNKTQTHRLTRDTTAALTRYLPDAPANGPLLRGSLKSGELTGPGMSVRAINDRVGRLGDELEIDSLSPHDCRHYWATRAIRQGSDPFAVLQAGGWTSMSTVQKYVDEQTIANEGIAEG